jgi:hypothetical protein
MDADLKEEGLHRGNGARRSDLPGRELGGASALDGGLEAHDCGVDLRKVALATELMRVPALLSAPVQEIARDLRITLREFIQQHPISPVGFGFNRSAAEPVRVEGLLGKLWRAQEQLESIINAQRALPPEWTELRVLTVGMQANVEMFDLAIHTAARDGELSERQLPRVMEHAIRLKAETAMVMAHMDKLTGQIDLQ